MSIEVLKAALGLSVVRRPDGADPTGKGKRGKHAGHGGSRLSAKSPNHSLKGRRRRRS